jgi:hypothetical protein
MKRGYDDALRIGDDVRAAIGRAEELADGQTVIGRMHLVLRDEHGGVKAERVVDNLIVDVGKAAIPEQLLASPSTHNKPTHMAIGTGATAPAAGNTALGAEIDRNALTSKTRSTNVLTMVGNWAAGDGTNSAIAEAGVFDAASTGNMYSRATFTAINKGASDTLQITWTFTFG